MAGFDFGSLGLKQGTDEQVFLIIVIINLLMCRMKNKFSLTSFARHILFVRVNEETSFF